MKKVIALLLVFLLVVSVPSFAEEGVSAANSNFNVKVTANSSHIGKIATIIVLNPGYTKSDFESEFEFASDEISSMESLLWFGQTLTDTFGKAEFCIEFPETAEAGDYKIYLNINGESYETSLRYISDTNKQNAVSSFNAAIDVNGSLSALNKAISDNTFTLSLFKDDEALLNLYNELNQNDKFYSLFKSFGSYSTELENLNNSTSLINKNLEFSLKLLKADLIADWETLESYILNENHVLGFDISKIDDTNKSYIFGNIVNAPEINTKEDIQKIINDSFILHGIHNAQTWGSIEGILSPYATELGLSFTDPGVDYIQVYQAMYNEKNNFQSISAIKERFVFLMNLYPKITVTPGGGGGGGGGGGASSAAKKDDGVISKPITTLPEKEEKEEVKEMKFSDVDKDFWAYDSIKKLYEKNILNGKSETLFGTDNFITREEIAAILVRAFNLEINNNIIMFNDISSENWYAKDVAVASSNGIINGYPDGSFGVGKNITRQDLAVMLYNLLKSENIELSENGSKSFSDDNKISDYAKDAVKLMSSTGIINGYADGCFYPFKTATRAEAAHLINLLLMQVN